MGLPESCGGICQSRSFRCKMPLKTSLEGLCPHHRSRCSQEPCLPLKIERRVGRVKELLLPVLEGLGFVQPRAIVAGLLQESWAGSVLPSQRDNASVAIGANTSTSLVIVYAPCVGQSKPWF